MPFAYPDPQRVLWTPSSRETGRAPLDHATAKQDIQDRADSPEALVSWLRRYQSLDGDMATFLVQQVTRWSVDLVSHVVTQREAMPAFVARITAAASSPEAHGFPPDAWLHAVVQIALIACDHGARNERRLPALIGVRALSAAGVVDRQHPAIRAAYRMVVGPGGPDSTLDSHSSHWNESKGVALRAHALMLLQLRDLSDADVLVIARMPLDVVLPNEPWVCGSQVDLVTAILTHPHADVEAYRALERYIFRDAIDADALRFRLASESMPWTFGEWSERFAQCITQHAIDTVTQLRKGLDHIVNALPRLVGRGLEVVLRAIAVGLNRTASPWLQQQHHATSLRTASRGQAVVGIRRSEPIAPPQSLIRGLALLTPAQIASTDASTYESFMASPFVELRDLAFAHFLPHARMTPTETCPLSCTVSSAPPVNPNDPDPAHDRIAEARTTQTSPKIR